MNATRVMWANPFKEKQMHEMNSEIDGSPLRGISTRVALTTFALLRFRRIGENEVTAVGICHALVAAQTHPGADTEADGLVKTVLPNVDHANTPVPFHGYYFRILSRSPGGFAAIAYPAQYRSSGVGTFVVNQYDIVYEKDLGRNTAAAAGAITTYQSGPTWTRAEPTH